MHAHLYLSIHYAIHKPHFLLTCLQTCAHTHRKREKQRERGQSPLSNLFRLPRAFPSQQALPLAPPILSALQCCSVHHRIEDIITLSSLLTFRLPPPTTREGMEAKRRCSLDSAWQSTGAEEGCKEDTHMASHTGASNAVKINSD